MAWSWFRRKVEKRSTYSVADPALINLMGWAGPTVAGQVVTEQTVLGLSGFYRAGALISGTIAGLPLRSLRTTTDDRREPVRSWVEDPAGPDSYTPFEWAEQVLWHLFLNGNAFLMHRYNGAGALVGLHPVHPLAVSVEWDAKRPGGKLFRATLVDGSTMEFDATTMTQILGPSADGLRGWSLVQIARNSLSTAIAGDRAAGKMFGNGAMMAGLITPDEDLEPGEAEVVRKEVNAAMSGAENSGQFAILNRKLNLQPWAMTAADSQFLEQRKFSIEEIARWTGVPPHLLMQTEKQTSWGTGVSEQNRGLKQFNLLGYTSRIEQRVSRLLPRGQVVEFDFAGLERPSPQDEIDLLIKQVDSGLLTPNEARRIRNLPPLEGGDVPRTGQSPAPDQEAAA